MSAELTHEERTAMALAERLKKDPALLRAYLAPPLGSKKVTPADERRMFWQKNPTDTLDDILGEFARMGQERGIDPQDAVGLAMETDRVRNSIADRLYPMRLKIVRAGERRFSPKAQIDFTNRMIRLGPPDDPLDTSRGDSPTPPPTAAREDQPDSMDISADPSMDQPAPVLGATADAERPAAIPGGMTDATQL